ncbi:MAG: divalent-cation tolerance protein CutA [Candidatus Altiarchaeota archaeon]
MLLIYITCKDRKEAEKISKHLLEKRLIACANIFPIKSMYWWKGKIENAKEFVIIAKTLDRYFPIIKKEVKRIHSYEVPCIEKIKTEANLEYIKWLKSELK